MKRLSHIFSLIIILLLVYMSFNSLMPKSDHTGDSLSEFSTERAMQHLNVIASAPHFVGTDAHTDVRNYITNELEKLGLETQIQDGFVLDQWNGFGNLVKPKNIVARIKGSDPSGKTMLLLSHYDSAPHSASRGASDAGSGVVTILESLRAYLASGAVPKNDIIVCITDAEELGLDGARLFVNEHPWAKNVGVALNFEARGSGGPSTMIVETNGGNSELIKAFMEASPDYPVATSLMYSIYKMLPNDTDSTVLREDGDIDGFFFAFIDDHYDYHTVNDNVENLDQNSLAHQGSYLMPLLHHFSNIDLTNLKSDVEYVYFDSALVKMIAYPFSWIWPMLILAILVFILLLLYGFKKQRLSGNEIGKGLGVFLLSLVMVGGLLFLLWELIKVIYPGYNEMLPVFIYNGHWYTAAFVCLALSLSFGIYARFIKPEHTASVLVAPIGIWLIINVGVALKLQGAAYFIIPVFFALIALWIHIRSTRPSMLFLSFLCAPALFILAPLLEFFPVGLGSDITYVSGILMVLVFGLLYSVFGMYRAKKWLGRFSLLLAIVFLFIAHQRSDFNEEQPRPNSLIYYANADQGKAYWATYDKKMDGWVKGYLGESPESASKYIGNATGSKYNTRYTYAKEAQLIPIPESEVRKEKDTVIDQLRHVALTIVPQRKVHQMLLYSDLDTPYKRLMYNGKALKPDPETQEYPKRRSKTMLSYYLSPHDSLALEYTIPAGEKVVFTLKEYSYDLLDNALFTMSARPKNTYPKQFIANDAVVLERIIDPDAYQLFVKDTLTIHTIE